MILWTNPYVLYIVNIFNEYRLYTKTTNRPKLHLTNLYYIFILYCFIPTSIVRYFYWYIHTLKLPIIKVRPKNRFVLRTYFVWNVCEVLKLGLFFFYYFLKINKSKSDPHLFKFCKRSDLFRFFLYIKPNNKEKWATNVLWYYGSVFLNLGFLL